MNLTDEQHKEWVENYIINQEIEYSSVYEDEELEEFEADEEDWRRIYDLFYLAKVTVNWKE